MATEQPEQTKRTELEKLDVKEWDQADIQQVGPGRIPNFYANNAAIGFTNWDAWFQFGQIIGQGEGKLVVEPKIRITMSLAHLKAFMTAVQDSIAQFEKQFGEIQIPVPLPKDKE